MYSKTLQQLRGAVFHQIVKEKIFWIMQMLKKTKQVCGKMVKLFP